MSTQSFLPTVTSGSMTMSPTPFTQAYSQEREASNQVYDLTSSASPQMSSPQMSSFSSQAMQMPVSPSGQPIQTSFLTRQPSYYVSQQSATPSIGPNMQSMLGSPPATMILNNSGDIPLYQMPTATPQNSPQQQQFVEDQVLPLSAMPSSRQIQTPFPSQTFEMPSNQTTPKMDITYQPSETPQRNVVSQMKETTSSDPSSTYVPEWEEVEAKMLEMGTCEQLANFFSRYSNHVRKSTKCSLDGRYFWKVLAPYTGLVDSDMYTRINMTKVEGKDELEPVFAYTPMFPPEELEEVKNAPVRYRLIKLIIDVADDPRANTGSVHSNLIYIDLANKEVVRFEPMYDEVLTPFIDTQLQIQFSSILPSNYTYRLSDEHPQLSRTESCPSKGMCAAYTLKKAMMLVTGIDALMNGSYEDEEQKILKFADAIEREYGPLPIEEDDELITNDDMIKVQGETGGCYRHREHGIGFGITLGGPNYASYPTYPQYYEPYPYATYPPPSPFGGFSVGYYGYNRGHRFGRRPGWGFGHHRRNHGMDDQTYNKMDAVHCKAYHDMHKKNFTPGQITKVSESGRPEYNRDRCGCTGCKLAPPEGEMGYWRRNEQGETAWQPVARGTTLIGSGQAFGGASMVDGRAYPGNVTHLSASDLRRLRMSNTPIYETSKTIQRNENGCGCNGAPKQERIIPAPGSENRIEGILPPSRWSPQTQTLAGAGVGALGGYLLTGGLGGAAIGAVAGGAGGYFLGKANRESRPGQYGRGQWGTFTHKYSSQTKW